MLRARDLRRPPAGVTRRATQAKLWPAFRRAAICVLGGAAHLRGRCARCAARVRAAACLSSISRGIGVDGVDQHGHGQLVQVAVVEDAAPGSHLKGALLLLFGALHVFLVAHDLQPEQAARDGAGPKQKEEADEPEARPPEGNGAWRGWRGCGWLERLPAWLASSSSF